MREQCRLDVGAAAFGGWALWVAVGVAMIPSAVHAEDMNDVVNAEYSLGADHAEIVITSKKALRAPRIRTQKGLVRIWFPNVPTNRRLDLEGDGSAIRWVKVRGGADESAVVQIRIGDRRRLSTGDIHVSTESAQTRIAISRPLLPLVQASKKKASSAVGELAAKRRASNEDNKSAGESAKVKSERSGAAQLGAAQSDTAQLGAAQLSNAQATKKQSTDAKFTPSLSSARSATVASFTPPRGTPYGLMALITALLGAVYLGVRLMNRSPLEARKADISIVASRRLGPRHQLVVVRALGEEHLLSIHGNSTQRIASSSPEDGEQEELGAFPLAGDLRETQDSLNTDQLPAPEVGGESRFGAQLLRLATAHRARRANAFNSEAVSGLMKLRARSANGKP